MRCLGLGLSLCCFGCSSSNGSDVRGNGGGDSGLGAAGRDAGGAGGLGSQAQTGVFVAEVVQTVLNRVDILFMIDNSPSMADKQAILKSALPVLPGRLMAPLCVDNAGNPAGRVQGGTCPSGSMPEFAPIEDIHIGIVSSSLGSHGGNVCGPDSVFRDVDDRAHLIGSLRPGLRSWADSGFLAWDPRGTQNTPAGESDANQLITDYAAMVQATAEHGCGMESSLEAWYRFLIDPEPPTSVAQVGASNVREGVDTELLAQRAAFLRPDSLLLIVMLSDENDCSIRDDGLGWMAGGNARLPKATAACESNPNDPCCRSCASSESSPPAGCLSLSADAVCKGDPSATWDMQHDWLGLRCYQQQRRFGVDFLYPTARYVEGLKQTTLSLPSDPSKVVVNPLFAAPSGKFARDPSLIFLAGIVGVPWQDLATSASLSSTSLEYLSARELAEQGRWPAILGQASAQPPVAPSDPFMVESIEPRSGMNPIAHVAITPAGSMDPKANPINGHERNMPDSDDLQYACTFPLATPKVCVNADVACDCAPDMHGDPAELTAINSPLCQPPGAGPPGSTQYFAKAYPSTRQLSVLRDFGENAVAASICPKSTTSSMPTNDRGYGYNPAFTAIVDRLKDALVGKCLPRALNTVPDPTGGFGQTIGCNMIEVQPGTECDCTKPGRSPAPAALLPAVFSQLKISGGCGDAAGQSQCDAANFCACQIKQETGDELLACVANQPTTPGFCYIDEPTSSALAQCPATQPQKLRFVGEDAVKIPAEGARLFLACDASGRAL
jgi:hypothetical protein